MKRYLLFLYTTLLLFNITVEAYAQQQSCALREREQHIRTLLDSILTIKNDSVKKSISNTLQDSLLSVLKNGRSFGFAFDSLKRLGKLKSPDNKIRVYTWNITLSDASYVYYGIIQSAPGKDSICKTFVLTDKSSVITTDISKLKLNSNNWYGALYYDIFPVKIAKQTVYTIMGIHYNTMYTTKKIIEILSISKDGEVTFGMPVFQLGKQVQNRVVFEYSVYASMGIRYYNSYKMIIFDHLAPSQPMYTGDYRYYGPDFTFDGFKFEKEKWVLYQNVDFKKEKK